MKTYPKIGIVGGGPGGLTLARILHLHGIAATVFERDENPSSRLQGGTLDLHPESGQTAIRLAGLDDAFRSVARYEDQETRMYDKTGKLLFESADAAGGDRPEVDRGALRQILLDALPDGMVRWASKLRTVQPQNDGTYILIFENGSTETFDLIAGADGAWSRVRPLVSSEEPLYTGVTFIDFGLDSVDTNHQEIAGLVGHGTTFALGDSKALIAQRNANAHIRVYAALRVPEDWVTQGGLDVSSPDARRHSLLTQFADWSPKLLALINECNDTIVPRPLYALPIGHRWTNRPGVTLLGDAAHLMSPFSGQGVNNAMLDAAELALALAQNDDWIRAVKSYERVMLERAETAARDAAEGLDSAIGPNAIEISLAWMQSHENPAEFNEIKNYRNLNKETDTK